MEGIINTTQTCVNFLNRSIPFFSKNEILLKPNGQRFMADEVPCMDDISGLVIGKLLECKAGCATKIQLKVT